MSVDLCVGVLIGLFLFSPVAFLLGFAMGATSSKAATVDKMWKEMIAPHLRILPPGHVLEVGVYMGIHGDSDDGRGDDDPDPVDPSFFPSVDFMRN